LLGGPETPAVGWGLGLERLIKLLPEAQPESLDYYLATDNPASGLLLADKLRQQGYRAEVDLSGKNLGKQLAQANKRKARFALIRGESEAEKDQWSLKDLTSGEQTTLIESVLLENLADNNPSKTTQELLL
jgi:histidyl-tRNA synthetase